MLTIFTGAPGAGKTSGLVSFLMTLEGNRPIYADGINGLALEHTAVDARQWHTVVPDGGIIAVDEGQRLWRPRGPGQKVPDDIAAMETHRHRGLDFVITTQHPKLLDQNVRNLCGRHVHIRDLGVLGRWWYEWPEAADPGSWRSAPIKKRYRLDKKSFAKYKSASLHVKPVRSFPWMLAVLIVAVLALAYLSWSVYGIIKGKMSPAKPPAAAMAPSASAGAVAGAPGAVAGSVGPARAYLSDASTFIPRQAAKPETAPAYDELRKVVVFPLVVGGYCQGSRCVCITQQGTDAGLSSGDCRAWLKAPPFNPYAIAQAMRQSVNESTQNSSQVVR